MGGAQRKESDQLHEERPPTWNERGCSEAAIGTNEGTVGGAEESGGSVAEVGSEVRLIDTPDGVEIKRPFAFLPSQHPRCVIPMGGDPLLQHRTSPAASSIPPTDAGLPEISYTTSWVAAG